jgi:hypothetical protein
MEEALSSVLAMPEKNVAGTGLDHGPSWAPHGGRDRCTPDSRPPRCTSQVGRVGPLPDMESFFPRQRLGNFAGALNEELDRRAEGPILQSKDRHFLRRNTEVDRQRFY